MTPKSLFVIVLRIVGLYIFIDILRVLPQILSTFNFLLRSGDISTGIMSALFSLLILLLYIFVIRYTLFRTDKIVERLSLDKNFAEEKFEFNMHRSTVIKIAIIVVGGMTLVEYFVPLILNLYLFIQSRSGQDEVKSVSNITIVRYILMVLIGYFLIGNSGTITNLIEKNRKK